MKKHLITKLLISLLMSYFILMFITECDVKAVSQSDKELIIAENEILDEGTILKYDRITNETTVVDLEELKEITSLLRNTSQESNLIAPEYNPNLLTYTSKISGVRNVSVGGWSIVEDTSPFPYLVTCRLTYRINQFKLGYGSGSLVGDNLLLTNAHCVFNEENNNVFSEWLAYPGYNNSPNQSLVSGWSTVYYPGKWLENHDDGLDWALCVLQNDLGTSVGYYGLQAYGTNAEMEGLTTRAIGYPSVSEEDACSYQYVSPGYINNAWSDHIKYTGKVAYGMSGGPIIRADNRIIAINKGYYTNSPEYGYGVRITQNIIDLILSERAK